MTRIKMTREHVRQWNPRWDEGDRRQIDALFDGHGDALSYRDAMSHRRREIDEVVAAIPECLMGGEVYRTRSNDAIHGRNARGEVILRIRPGGIDLRLTEGIRTIIELSTTPVVIPPRVGGAKGRPVLVCPVHHTTLPASGICDDCG